MPHVAPANNTDVELIELPACQSKRSLYRSFLHEQGWTVSFDSKSRKVSKKLLDTTNKEEQEGSAPISWPTFCHFWKQHYSKIVIQRPAEDLCGDCVVFANKHKYTSQLLFNKGEEESASRKVNYDKLEKETEEQEELILTASHHVEMARKQQQLFIGKKEAAKQTRDLPPSQRTYCFVCNFAQNMYLPNFAAEQPGATYYYSPLNVYPFGIVDCTKEPSELTALMFYEGKRFSVYCSFFSNKQFTSQFFPL
jgi:hypothetical protein